MYGDILDIHVYATCCIHVYGGIAYNMSHVAADNIASRHIHVYLQVCPLFTYIYVCISIHIAADNALCSCSVLVFGDILYIHVYGDILYTHVYGDILYIHYMATYCVYMYMRHIIRIICHMLSAATYMYMATDCMSRVVYTYIQYVDNM